jgi:hypothetical protein
VALAAFGAAARAAALASPNTMGTFRESMDLLTARIGSFVVPVFEQMARSAQQAVAWLDRIPAPVREGAAGAVGAAAGGGVGTPGGIQSLVRDVAGAPIKWITGKSASEITAEARAEKGGFGQTWLGQKMLGVAEWATGAPPPMKRSLAGLPETGFASFESVGDEIQKAVLNTSDLQTDLLKQQLEELRKIAAREGRGGEPAPPRESGFPGW